MSPTRSKSATSRRVRRADQGVTYEPQGSVALRLDETLARNLGRASVHGAWQYVLEMRQHARIVVQTYLDAGRPDKAVWFASDLLALLDVGMPPASLDGAALDEARTDGVENERWEAYRNDPSLPNWKLYERAAHRDVAALLAKLAAGRAVHGRTM